MVEIRNFIKTESILVCSYEMKRVLVCDDDKDILYIVTFALTNIGFEVFTSTDCKNIIQKIRDIQPSVVIMDNVIPDDGGIATTQILKNHPESKHIPVIFFTANDNIRNLSEAAGADFYLGKPYEIERLQRIVLKAYNTFMPRGDSEGIESA
jgi:CheY-like chemotaxis protein